MAQQTGFDLTSDFSPIASRYDATRDLPERHLSACFDRLIERGLFPLSGVVLDVGCGTGQLSLPLAKRGYEVLGIDVSAEMIKLAQSKVRQGWNARYTVADVRCMPNDDASVDAVVVSKLFQHIQDWEKACHQLIRVVQPGGYIFQINERGAFGNSVRRYFSRRATERGFASRFIGLNPHSDSELTAVMSSQRCLSTTIDMSDVPWDTEITYGEALDRIRERLFAEFWYLPLAVYDELVDDTLSWIEAQPGGAKTVEHFKPYLIVTAFQTPRV